MRFDEDVAGWRDDRRQDDDIGPERVGGREHGAGGYQAQ
jgi:hypothetical protein